MRWRLKSPASRLFTQPSMQTKKTSKLRVTGLCARNSPVTGEFPAQRASDAENVSIWWRHHAVNHLCSKLCTARRFEWTFVFITVKLHERHSVLNYQLTDCLFNSLFRLTTKKVTFPHHWRFMREINRCPATAPLRGQSTLKKGL